MTDMSEKRDEGPRSSRSSDDVLDTTTSDPISPIEKEWLPIRAAVSRKNSLPPGSRSSSRPNSIRSMSRVRSQNGYSCDNHDETDSENTADPEAAAEKDPYEVGWDDGENDPLNPRSKSKVMKWLIVIICSLSSLCV